MNKAVVIGASVAGLSTGLELLKLDPDLDVSIYERKRSVGEHTVCGGALSFYMMGKVGLEIPRDCVAARIRKARIYAPNGTFWEGGGGEYGYVLWRELWERHMAEEFQSLGGELTLKSRVVMEDLPHLCRRFDVVVAADGLTGVTRHFLGLPLHRKEDVHVCVQRIVSLSEHPNDRVDLYFGNKIAPQGYAWVFPEGWKRQARVGLGLPLSKDEDLMGLLTKLMVKVHAGRPVFPQAAKLIPTAPPPKTGVHDNIVLVGDAAPWCDPLTGGGICQAVASGKACARAIVEGKLWKYDGYMGWLRRQNAIRYELKKILCDLQDQDLNEMVGAMRGFKPSLTRISWAIAQALAVLALKKPKLLIKHRALRRLLNRVVGCRTPQ